MVTFICLHFVLCCLYLCPLPEEEYVEYEDEEILDDEIIGKNAFLEAIFWMGFIAS